MAISNEEREFFVALGERITALRKARGITQVQLAETLGVSQQTVQAYEVGRRRIQVVVSRTPTARTELFLPISRRLAPTALRCQFDPANFPPKN